MFVFSPYFFWIMEIHFSQVLGIVWISASSKMSKKPINLNCLCFSIPFPSNGNPLFPCSGNCMDFWINQKISETPEFLLYPKYLRNFGMFFPPHTFPILWKFTFPMFPELCGFLLNPKFLRNP